MSELIIVADVGGTHCRTGVAGPEGLVDYAVDTTPQTADDLFGQLGSRIIEWSERYDIATKYCALAMPGPISKSDRCVVEGISMPELSAAFMPSEHLVRADSELSNYRIEVLNDADAATLAVAWKYAKDDNREPLLYLGIGTGIGSDISKDYETLSHSAGLHIEIGYMPLFYEAGSYATLGNRVNGQSIPARFDANAKQPISQLYEQGTQAIWDDIGSDIGKAVAVVTPIVGLAQAVIGGGVGANCRSRIEQPLRQSLAEACSTIEMNISTTPEVSFVTPEIEKLVGLQGCYIATQQRHLME